MFVELPAATDELDPTEDVALVDAGKENPSDDVAKAEDDWLDEVVTLAVLEPRAEKSIAWGAEFGADANVVDTWGTRPLSMGWLVGWCSLDGDALVAASGDTDGEALDSRRGYSDIKEGKPNHFSSSGRLKHSTTCILEGGMVC